MCERQALGKSSGGCTGSPAPLSGARRRTARCNSAFLRWWAGFDSPERKRREETLPPSHNPLPQSIRSYSDSPGYFSVLMNCSGPKLAPFCRGGRPFNVINTGGRWPSDVLERCRDVQLGFHAPASLVPAYWLPEFGLYSVSMTASRLKLPGFCRGGNSFIVERNCPTMAWAGTSR